MTAELQRGDIYFFYRPRVNVDEVRSLDDVQRLFLVLHVDGTHRLRDIIVGAKHLPDLHSHERAWAFVAQVSDRAEDIRPELRQRTYETKTRGERRQPPARPAGEGRYIIADHDVHSHLACVLGIPLELDAPEWLDHEGVELVIIGAAEEPGRELGLELDPQAERVHDASLFRDLRIRPGELPLEPLRSGRLR